jgi:hypothetical protein
LSNCSNTCAALMTQIYCEGGELQAGIGGHWQCDSRRGTPRGRNARRRIISAVGAASPGFAHRGTQPRPR